MPQHYANCTGLVDAAIAFSPNSYLYLEEEGNEDILIEEPMPLKLVLKRDEYRNLSQEAKEIIEIILHSFQHEDEMFILKRRGEKIICQSNKILKRELSKNLRKKGWKWVVIWEIYKELGEFVATF